jgi:two-component system sensor kinase Ihk
MLRKKGIVRRTFFFSALLTIVVIAVAFSILYFTMPGYYRKIKEIKLADSLHALTSSLAQAGSEEECAALISKFSETNNVSVLAFDQNDAVLPTLSTPFVSLQGAQNVGLFTQKTEQSDGKQTYLVLIRSRKPAGAQDDLPELMLKWTPQSAAETMTLHGEIGTALIDNIAVSGTLQPIDEAKDVILSLSPYVLVIAVLIGVILSGIYARQISKPVLAISDAAVRMQNMEDDAASVVHSEDELGQLSDNLNALYRSLRSNIAQLQTEMDKVQHLEQSKTEMMQGAGHELKTPIAALNGMVEGMIDNIGVYKDKEKYLLECKKQIHKLSMLVEEILGASKVDILGGDAVSEAIDIDALVHTLLEEGGELIRQKKLSVQIDLPPTAIKTDPAVFGKAVSNLIANAVRYTPHGGNIAITACPEGETLLFSIENDCAPIPDDEIDKLFEPFYTRDYSRNKVESGTGLGLYIVQRSLERLGIPYKAESTESGFKITMLL